MSARWTRAELDRLDEMWSGGASLRTICDDLGRSRAAVRGKVAYLGLRRPRSGSPATPWADDDVRLLREMWERGERLKAIGARLGRSRNSITNKVHKLGLKRRASEPSQSISIYLPIRLIPPDGCRSCDCRRGLELLHALRDAGIGHLSPAEIVALCGE